MIAALLSDLWPYIIAAGAFIAGALGLYAKGRGDAKAKAAADKAKADTAAHERMNDAPDLRNASDDDRVKWLRDFAERNRRP